MSRRAFLMVVAVAMQLLLGNPPVPSAVAVAAATPDLAAKLVGAVPEGAIPDESFEVTVGTRNLGSAPARRSATRVYLSTNRFKEAHDVRVGSVNVARLTPNTLSEDTLVLTVPSTAATGRYYLIVCADDRHQVAESRENNNCSATNGRMLILAVDLCQALAQGGGAANWQSLLTSNGKVRVWWQSKYDIDTDAAQRIVTALNDVIWPELTDVMGEPRPDGGGSSNPCRGPDGAIDLALVTFAKGGLGQESGLAFPYDDPSTPDATPGIDCSATSGFVTMDRTETSHQLELVAHELMHIIQFGYPMRDTADGCREYRWVQEATATWAQDLVYQDTQSEHPFAKDLLDRPWVSLDDHDYGAYLFFLYLTRMHHGEDPQQVGALWRNAASMGSLDAVDAAIPGGFENVWPDFAFANYNRPPHDTYVDEVADGAKLEKTVSVDLGTATEKVISLSKVLAKGDPKLPHLSARYFKVNISDPAVREISVTNPFADGQPVNVDVLYGGNRETVSGGDAMSLCRDDAAEDVDELVVIVSNYSHDRQSVDLGNLKLTAKSECEPRFPERFEGTFEGTYREVRHPDYSIYTQGWTFTESWSGRVSLDLEELNESGGALYEFDTMSVTYTLEGSTFSGTDSCTVSGSAVSDVGLDAGPDDGLWLFPTDPTQGTSSYSYTMRLENADFSYTGTTTCTGPSGTYTLGGPSAPFNDTVLRTFSMFDDWPGPTREATRAGGNFLLEGTQTDSAQRGVNPYHDQCGPCEWTWTWRIQGTTPRG